MHSDEKLEHEFVTLHNGDVCRKDEARFCGSDYKWYHKNDGELQWCETDEIWYFEDEMIYCDVDDGGQGWVHQSTDPPYSDYSDRYFQSADAAINCGFVWSKIHSDWVPMGLVEDRDDLMPPYRGELDEILSSKSSEDSKVESEKENGKLSDIVYVLPTFLLVGIGVYWIIDPNRMDPDSVFWSYFNALAIAGAIIWFFLKESRK